MTIISRLTTYCLQTIIILFLFFSSTYITATPEPNFTQQELEWINKNPIITYGAETNWAPYDFVDKQKKHIGISNDYLKLISLKSGLKFKANIDVWDTLLKKIRHQEIDLLPSIYISDSRKKYLIFSQPYQTMAHYFFKRDDVNIDSLTEMDGMVIAIPKGYSTIEDLKIRYPKLVILETLDIPTAISSVIERKADLLLDTHSVINYHLKEKAITTIHPFLELPSDEVITLHMASSNKNPMLISIINKSLASISEKNKQQIHNKWLSNTNTDTTIFLSQTEKNWLNNHPTIRFTGDPDWLPYEAFDKYGKHIGITSDFLNIVQQKLGIKIEIIPSNSWPEAINSIKNNDVDIISQSIEWEPTSELQFTQAYLSSPVVIIMQDDNNYVENLEQISDKKIAVVNGYAYLEQMKKEYSSINFYSIDTVQNGLIAVSSGKVDALIGTLAQSSYYISEVGMTNLRVVGNTPYKTQLAFGMRKEFSPLIPLFNRALNDISHAKRREIIKSWGKPEVTTQVDYQLIFKIIFFSIVIILIFIAWNRRLKHEINLREEAEKQKQLLLDNIPLQVIVSTYEGKIISANPQALKDYHLNKKDINKYNMSDFYQNPRDRELIQDEMLEKRKIEQKIMRLKKLDGTPISMMVSITPIIYDQQNVLLSIGVNIDERLKMEFDLKIAQEKITQENTLLKSIMSSTKDQIFYKDKDLNYIGGNQPFFNFIGKTKDEVIGKNDAEIFGQERGSIYHQNDIQILNTNSVKNNEEYVLSLEGHKVYFSTQKIPFAYDNEHIGIVGISRDITSIHLAEENLLRLNDELKKSQERFKLAVSGSGDALWEYDASTQKSWVSKRHAEMLGYSNNNRSDMNGSWTEILKRYIHPDDKDYAFLAFNLHQQKDVPFDITYRLKTCHGEWRWFQARAKSLRLKSGIAYRTSGSVSDITEQKKFEKQLSKSKEIAESATRAKSEFLSNMSHEIRTPMNAIIGFTELLNEQISDPKLQSFVNTIQSAGNNLLTLINDILDLSKIEAGKLLIEKKPCNPHDLFDELANIFMMKIREKNLDLIINVDPNIPMSMEIDAPRLRQVLFNLIGNAIKFTEKGFIRIRVSTNNENKIFSQLDLMINVEDTGIGIDKDQQSLIFNDFEQSSGQDVRKYGGTGLGLSISKRLVDMMDGEISLNSQKNKGSTFSIKLKSVNVSSLVINHDKIDNLNEEVIFSENNILIVDDIQNNRELLLESFFHTSLHCTQAINGLEAVELAKKNNYKLILMDIRMPIMDGYEAATQIRKFSDVKIIALTASVMSDDFERNKRDNFDGYLRKPILQVDLITELKKHLPFKVIKSNVETYKEVSLTNDEINNFTKINNELLKLIKECDTLSKTNNISGINEFAENILVLMKEHPIEALVNYSQKLKTDLESFNIAAIKCSLNDFQKLIKQLEVFCC